MKKTILLGWILSSFGFAASAYAEFSMNAVADGNVAIDAQNYAQFETKLNKYEPNQKIWVQKEARITEEDIEVVYADSVEIVEDPWAVPPKILDRLPCVTVKFKDTSSQKLEKFTSENINKRIAIILDGEILAAPKVYEPIRDGVIQFNGNWTAEEVTLIVNKIATTKNKS